MKYTCVYMRILIIPGLLLNVSLYHKILNSNCGNFVSFRWILQIEYNKRGNYGSVPKYRNSITQNDKIQNQITRQESQTKNNCQLDKSFLEFHLVFKNVRLKFYDPY